MEVGDYVRTKKNKIYKIIDKKFDETILVVLYQTDISGYLMEMDIKKSSPNIIDLIEIGDYVNGYLVIDIVKGFKVIIDKLELDTTTGLYYNIGIIDIKSIVTKEMFANAEYRVETD